MATVTINEYFEGADIVVPVVIDLDDPDMVYHIEDLGMWLDETNLNKLIKLLNRAKRVRKTRTINEGD